MEAIDKKYLAGLKFRTAKDGEPVKRNLTPADVLDWKDKGGTVVIVTGDGQKYTVDKNAKPAKEEGAEK
jgi:hypothetical protein